MPRLVRRRPLSERILSQLNPYDWLLWLSEEFEGGDWDQLEKNWALPIGIALNVIFLIARANSRSGGSQAFDDVFGDENSTSLRGWLVCCNFPSYNLSSVLYFVLEYCGLNANRLCSFLGLIRCTFNGPCLRGQCRLHVPQEEALSSV